MTVPVIEQKLIEGKTQKGCLLEKARWSYQELQWFGRTGTVSSETEVKGMEAKSHQVINLQSCHFVDS